MTNVEICKDSVPDNIFKDGKKIEICNFWDLGNPGLCKHDSHEVCVVYLLRNKIADPWLVDFMQTFGCVIERKIK